MELIAVETMKVLGLLLVALALALFGLWLAKRWGFIGVERADVVSAETVRRYADIPPTDWVEWAQPSPGYFQPPTEFRVQPLEGGMDVQTRYSWGRDPVTDLDERLLGVWSRAVQGPKGPTPVPWPDDVFDAGPGVAPRINLDSAIVTPSTTSGSRGVFEGGDGVPAESVSVHDAADPSFNPESS